MNYERIEFQLKINYASLMYFLIFVVVPLVIAIDDVVVVVVVVVIIVVVVVVVVIVVILQCTITMSVSFSSRNLLKRFMC